MDNIEPLISGGSNMQKTVVITGCSSGFGKQLALD